MNKMLVIGNLAKDAVQIEGKDGRAPFLSFSVICNEKWGDKEIKKVFEVNSSAVNLLEFLKSGKKVYVAGTPKVKAYMNKEDKPAAVIQISANEIELL